MTDHHATIAHDQDKVSAITIFLYMLPPIGCGYMFCLVNLYIMKFSTDVLLIAPAVMGLIFGVSRVWDAISDPIAGYLSDKTQTALGRRRPWILGSIIPIAISFLMISNTPDGLSATELSLWMAAAILAFFTAQTVMIVPHMSLGAELSVNTHERNKVFAARHAGWIAGYIIALGTMYLLIDASRSGLEAVRTLMSQQSYMAVLLTTLCLSVTAIFIRERPEFLGRGARKPYGAARDIWSNPHARLTLIINFVENLGGATIVILTLYVAQYIMHNAGAAPLFILSYMVCSFLFTPLWAPLARRVGKKNLWFMSLILTGVAFLLMITLRPGDELYLYLLSALAGTAGGCGGTVGPSIKSDVIDYDEYLTGERKEGSYFAAWNFISKSSYGVMMAITGFALSIAGFAPNVDQTPQVENTLRFLYSVVPFVSYCAGALLLLRFDFDETKHSEVRRELERRNQVSAEPTA